MNNPQKGGVSHTLTMKYNRLMNVIFTTLKVSTPGSATRHDFTGIWDTGASATVITEEVVKALNLQPVGFTFVNTASQQNVSTPQYMVDVHLKDGLYIPVTVTLGILSNGFHLLIGMDIIGKGDFSVTNHNGATCMSYRYPSSHEIDYVKTPSMGMANVTSINTRIEPAVQISKKPAQNAPCYCGSGLKYKRCHGKI